MSAFTLWWPLRSKIRWKLINILHVPHITSIPIHLLHWNGQLLSCVHIIRFINSYNVILSYCSKVCLTAQTLLRVLSHGSSHYPYIFIRQVFTQLTWIGGFKQILGIEGNSSIATDMSVWDGVSVCFCLISYFQLQIYQSQCHVDILYGFWIIPIPDTSSPYHYILHSPLPPLSWNLSKTGGAPIGSRREKSRIHILITCNRYRTTNAASPGNEERIP